MPGAGNAPLGGGRDPYTTVRPYVPSRHRTRRRQCRDGTGGHHRRSARRQVVCACPRDPARRDSRRRRVLPALRRPGRHVPRSRAAGESHRICGGAVRGVRPWNLRGARSRYGGLPTALITPLTGSDGRSAAPSRVRRRITFENRLGPDEVAREDVHLMSPGQNRHQEFDNTAVEVRPLRVARTVGHDRP